MGSITIKSTDKLFWVKRKKTFLVIVGEGVLVVNQRNNSAFHPPGSIVLQSGDITYWERTKHIEKIVVKHGMVCSLGGCLKPIIHWKARKYHGELSGWREGIGYRMINKGILIFVCCIR